MSSGGRRADNTPVVDRTSVASAQTYRTGPRNQSGTDQRRQTCTGQQRPNTVGADYPPLAPRPARKVISHRVPL